MSQCYLARILGKALKSGVAKKFLETKDDHNSNDTGRVIVNPFSPSCTLGTLLTALVPKDKSIIYSASQVRKQKSRKVTSFAHRWHQD